MEQSAERQGIGLKSELGSVSLSGSGAPSITPRRNNKFEIRNSKFEAAAPANRLENSNLVFVSNFWFRVSNF